MGPGTLRRALFAVIDAPGADRAPGLAVLVSKLRFNRKCEGVAPRQRDPLEFKSPASATWARRYANATPQGSLLRPVNVSVSSCASSALFEKNSSVSPTATPTWLSNNTPGSKISTS
jgi:hypothetical protein